MIEGISHITLVVENLEKTTHFLKFIFGANEVYSSGSNIFSVSQEKFFMINDVWIAIMRGDSLPTKSYNHIAFKIPDELFDEYVSRVKSTGVEIKMPRNRVEGEGSSIYFYDYDNHLFENHTGTLEQRLSRYNTL